METKIATSIEQSKKLLELGLDVNTADMCWSLFNPDLDTLLAFPFIDADNRMGDKVPAWSLNALLELMPKTKDVDIELCYGGWRVGGEMEFVEKWFLTFEHEEKGIYKNFSCEDPLDATFEMACWLKVNKLI